MRGPSPPDQPAPAPHPATVPTMADYAGIWPAGQLLSDGGKVWRNVTTVPLTTAPSGFPGQLSQWTHLFTEEVKTAPNEPSKPDEWPAWEPWDHVRPLYQVGAQVHPQQPAVGRHRRKQPLDPRRLRLDQPRTRLTHRATAQRPAHPSPGGRAILLCPGLGAGEGQSKAK